MRCGVLVALVLLWAMPVSAIISKLDKNGGGSILMAAEESAAVLESYARNEIALAEVTTMLTSLCQRNVPTCTLSAADTTDLTNIIALIDGVPATDFQVPGANALLTTVIRIARKIDMVGKYRRLAIQLQSGLITAATMRQRLPIPTP